MRPLLYFLSTLLYAAAMAMIVAEKRILRSLMSAGAVNESTAIEYHPQTFLHTLRLNRLLGKGAVVRTPSNKLYVDETGFALYRTGRRRRAIIIIGIALLLVLLLLWYEGSKPKLNEDSQYTLVTRTNRS